MTLGIAVKILATKPTLLPLLKERSLFLVQPYGISNKEIKCNKNDLFFMFKHSTKFNFITSDFIRKYYNKIIKKQFLEPTQSLPRCAANAS